MGESLLEVNGLTMAFGSLYANQDVTFDVPTGQIVALIGPNGAGKTTCFNCVTGFPRPTGESIRFAGTDITHAAPYDVCRLGLARTFQIVHTFHDMTVMENILTAAFLRESSTREAATAAQQALELTGLGHLQDKLGRSLTIAGKKRIEIARALATKPRLIMLDETMAGLNQTEIREAMDLCVRLKKEGLTLVIVEHIMEAIMPISDKVVVLDSGRKIMEGTPQEVTSDERVIKAYLGDTGGQLQCCELDL
ncbi:MAG: ABC transporter ATP-binding protein [Clostridia bacterium]|nr:ABC transporter ATP-binding protein [Clostridia bacterium]